MVEQDKVAQYLYNAPEYLESVFAAFKAGLAIVNTNFRYAADELVYLWDNADVVAVVFHGAFAERIDRDPRPGCRASAPGCGSTTAAVRARDWAQPYEDAAAATTAETVMPAGRGGAPATTSCCSTPAARPACRRA